MSATGAVHTLTYVRTSDGVVKVEAGQTIPDNATAEHVEALEASGVFDHTVFDTSTDEADSPAPDVEDRAGEDRTTVTAGAATETPGQSTEVEGPKPAKPPRLGKPGGV